MKNQGVHVCKLHVCVVPGTPQIQIEYNGNYFKQDKLLLSNQAKVLDKGDLFILLFKHSMKTMY